RRRKDELGGGIWKGALSQEKLGLLKGMRVLCLDVFVSRIGGGEIRRWRPAEIKKVIVGELDDEVTVRIVFSSYAIEEQSLCLRLKRDWRRLAPALSLTEEEMSSGAPLQGDTLAASRRQFHPRFFRRDRDDAAAATAATTATAVTVPSSRLARGGTTSAAAAAAMGRVDGNDGRPADRDSDTREGTSSSRPRGGDSRSRDVYRGELVSADTRGGGGGGGGSGGGGGGGGSDG
ncbi:unnamed protein product, partial [Laminaria digitata]